MNVLRRLLAIADRDRLLATLIVTLGLLHALIYALVIPPWGLLDESQHFHYIQVVAQEHRLPVMWRDRLSEEIVDSIFAVKRYVTLGADGMPDRARISAPGLLDTESYEAHHPPLYFAVLALFYPLGPSDVLSKLFVLRVVGVVLSSVTLIVVWKSSRWLWPGHAWIAVVATLFVALNPERAASAARLSNDVLLEVMCAVAFGLLSLAWAKGLSYRLALALAIVLGLATLTKFSGFLILPIVVLGWIVGALVQRQPWRTTTRQILVIVAGTAACMFPVVARNLILYNDITGIRAFIAHTGPLVTGPVSELVVVGVVDLFRNSWAILWDGVRVVSKPSAALLYLALAAETVVVAVVLLRAWVRQDRQFTPLIRGVMLTALAALILVSTSTLLGYVRGLLPTVQGRFLLPALVPLAWLVGFGLWLVGSRWRGLMAALLLFLETALGMSVLFFHSLPQFYAPRDIGFLGYWKQSVFLFFAPAGMFWDKPSFVSVWAVILLIVAFVACLIAIGVVGIRRYGNPVGPSQLHAAQGFVKSQRLPPPAAHGSQHVEGQTRWIGQLRRIVKDPLLWAMVALVGIYLGWVSLYPSGIFWSLDEGGKYIHLQSIVASGDPGGPLLYPGRYLDHKLQFVPLHFWSRWGDQVYSWWPVGFQLITTPFYAVFGWYGVYLLPALGGALTALLTGLLVRYICPQRPWLSTSAALVTGLATPVAFYSTTYWEHTANVACLLGGVLSICHAWRTGRARWVVVAGVLLAIATYLRTDTVGMVMGIALVLLVSHWRWSLLLGTAYALASVPWLVSNRFLMGHVLSRQWIPGNVSLSVPVLSGIQETGIWFVPYVLFNSPRVAAFSLGSGLLALATLLTAIALLAPMLDRSGWTSLVAIVGLILVCGWVLAQPEGYRSVHGFVLIAPHVAYAGWLYRSRSLWANSLLPPVMLGICAVYGMMYVARAWVPAGGLQWGPRYLLAFYPLFVCASISGLATAWSSLGPVVKRGLLGLYLVAALVGFGYQARGMYGALETRRYYQQTEEHIQQLESETIVTSCPWLAMVMPDLYWGGTVFTVSDDAAFGGWVADARQAGVHSVCWVEMDLCELTPLDEIATGRATNPGGVEATCYAE